MLSLCDSNVWLALALSDHVHHAAACSWLESVDEPASIHFCRTTQQTLLRLLTNAAVLAPYGNPPLTNREAWSVYERFTDDDRIVLRTDEPPGLDECWQRFAVRDSASTKLWTDSYLASFALTGGYRMVTSDVAFRQFKGLDLLVLTDGGRAS